MMPIATPPSFLAVNYELRPAKQIERRILVDALQKLALAGFQIRDYQYTGFGSIYFVDFVLFHKILGISRMLSIENKSDWKRRVDFNKPYDCVTVEIGDAGDYIGSLSRDLKHFLWLDYDMRLSRGQLSDIFLAASHLTNGSILLVTVDVKPPEPENDDQRRDLPKFWHDYFLSEDVAGDYIADFREKLDQFVESKLTRLNMEILGRVLRSGLVGRREAGFIPLFSFLYADGTHPMLSIGGMIGGPEERRRLTASGVQEEGYYRTLDDDPFPIEVPKLTRRERLYLDAAMPCKPEYRPPDFDLSPEAIQAYRKIYRFFPAYAELLL